MAYATVTDARNEGVPATIVDGTIQAALDTWSQFIDRACRQFFESRNATIDINGNDSRILFLPVPVITVTSLFTNANFTTALPTTDYKVYAERGPVVDNRKNPKIELTNPGQGIYDLPRTQFGMFLRGTQNQRVIGAFGYTESDGTTPKLIKRAVLKLALRQLMNGGPTGGLWNEINKNTSSGKIMSETTDGHTVTYDAFRINPSNPGLSGITGDQEVDRIIDMYRAPIAMGVPGSSIWLHG